MPDLPAWNTRAAAMTPLVAAYDGRIEELEQLNKIQVRAFFEFDWIWRHPRLSELQTRAHQRTYMHRRRSWARWRGGWNLWSTRMRGYWRSCRR